MKIQKHDQKWMNSEIDKALGIELTENDIKKLMTTKLEKPQVCTLEAISEAMKKIAMMPDTRESDKILGLRAANLKFNQPEDYRKMSDEDKALINNAIERAAYINREELQQRILMA